MKLMRKVLDQFCIKKSLLTNTIYRHKPNGRFTRLSPNGVTENQTDHIITSQNNKKIFKNSCSYQSADIGLNHSLVITK